MLSRRARSASDSLRCSFIASPSPRGFRARQRTDACDLPRGDRRIGGGQLAEAILAHVARRLAAERHLALDYRLDTPKEIVIVTAAASRERAVTITISFGVSSR